MPTFGSLSKLAPAAGDWDDQDAYLLPAKDPVHPCPRCGEPPWAPLDGFGRMCDWCGWMWEIDRPDAGALRILGPSPASDEAMQKLLADGAPDSEQRSLLSGHRGMRWTRDHFALWLQLRHAGGIKEGPSWPDAVHSSLLDRIASGGPVFENAPPLRYSYPWIALCANGWDIAGTDDDPPVDSGQTLTIAQSPWAILGRYEKQARPAWRLGYGPWTAVVEWEDGPFDVGDRYSPPPAAAFVIRLAAPARLIDLTARRAPLGRPDGG